MKTKRKTPEIRFRGFSDDWEQRKLGEVTERVTRKNLELESELPLTISAQDGLIDQEEYFNKKVASRDLSGYYLLKKGEFAYNKSYSNGYPLGAIKRLNRYNKGVLSTLYICFNPISVDGKFLEIYYDSDKWHREVSQHTAEGARNHGLLNISAKDFFSTNLLIPNFDEQNKVSNFFENVNNTITLHQRKLQQLKEVKRGMLLKMFPRYKRINPSIRFNEDFDWIRNKLESLITKNSEKNKELLIDYVESISNKTGFTSQTLQFEDYSVASKNLSNYYIIRENCFAYNPSRINVGSIAYKHKGDKISVVSPLYISFYTGKNLEDLYLWYWLKGQEFDRQREVYSEGGVRDTLSYNQLKEIKISYPDKKEQKLISSFFLKLDRMIELQERETELLEETKKGFLQKMFV